MAFAKLADFTLRHGSVDSDEEDRVTALLTDASALIAAEVEGSEPAWLIDEDAAVPGLVVAVTVEAAYRAWANPDALGETRIADIGHAWRGQLPDALYLTAEEKRRVRRSAGIGSFRAMTLVSPYSGDVEVMDPADPDA